MKSERNFIMPKVELNLEDDELKELLLGDRDKAMQSIMAKILDEILKSEATEQIKAKAYERSDERTNSRHGYRVRQLTTRVGSLELHVPKLRHGNFSTQLFKRYQRSEQAFDLALMEMVIQGVSTRKVAEITKKLWSSPKCWCKLNSANLSFHKLKHTGFF
ncbi:transposase [Limosilactobacillus fermentum]|nr:transposase [Limosilactobacillus fermentum]